MKRTKVLGNLVLFGPLVVAGTFMWVKAAQEGYWWMPLVIVGGMAAFVGWLWLGVWLVGK